MLNKIVSIFDLLKIACVLFIVWVGGCYQGTVASITVNDRHFIPLYEKSTCMQC